MAFIFQPKLEQEIRKFPLLEPGDYDFEVIECKEGLSKAGNNKLDLTLDVYKSDGGKGRVWDTLVNLPSCEFKIRHFCYAAGLEKEYESGHLSPEYLVGKCGKAKIYIHKDKAGEYPDRNKVLDYYPRNTSLEYIGSKNDTNLTDAPFNDDLPF